MSIVSRYSGTLVILKLTDVLLLATVRNKMVHEHGFNSLPDHQGFATSYDQVEKELKQKLAARKGSSTSVCVIS